MSFPRKYLISDLVNKPAPVEVWLQGTIEQTVGNDILIISDTFGKAKITKCETADGLVNKTSLKKGKIALFLEVLILVLIAELLYFSL